MAPACASPQPSDDGPDIARRAEQSEPGQPVDQQETFGPLDVERHVKGDGRGLILYAMRESARRESDRL